LEAICSATGQSEETTILDKFLIFFRKLIFNSNKEVPPNGRRPLLAILTDPARTGMIAAISVISL
jgi:hypothetical protein